MSLRSGKSLQKDATQAIAVVDGAMESMTIAPEGSTQTSMAAGTGDMEVDDDGSQTERHADEEDTVSVEAAREHVKSLGVIFREKTSSKMSLYARMSRNKNGGTDEEKQRYDTISLELDTIREQMVEWNSMIDDLETADKSVTRAAPVSGTNPSPTSLPTGTKTPEDESEIKLSSEFPRYHRRVELHLMPRVDSKVSGPVRTNVRGFLHEFRKTGVLKYGRKKFGGICYRLLSLANLDEKTADAFVVAHDEDPDGVWDWDRCEQTFVDSALTPLEKAAEVDEFAKAGREKTESYKEFFHRLKRLVEVYKVRELPKHADVTQTLRMSIPSLALTVMQIAEIQKMILKFIGMPMPDTTSLDFLMESIPNVYGPDDCTEWRTVIDAARRNRVTKESEDAKVAQQAREKQQHQHKKAAMQTTAVGTAGNGAPTAQQQTNNTYQSKRGGGHGFFNQQRGGRGGRGHPYQRGGYNGESSVVVSTHAVEEKKKEVEDDRIKKVGEMRSILTTTEQK
ncbi:hypothetical protein BG011_001853 [Mortierella polycephala]|uniref:Gag protein n=1 Tax=Mortierella polycephala TaxID=41804 RepID=A0A9P6PL05_9FUNG|nr:hypothetical protein BG011_001853 [Mortierella polycephala]